MTNHIKYCQLKSVKKCISHQIHQRPQVSIINIADQLIVYEKV